MVRAQTAELKIVIWHQMALNHEVGIITIAHARLQSQRHPSGRAAVACGLGWSALPVPVQIICDSVPYISDPNIVQEKLTESMFVVVGSLDDLRQAFAISEGILVFRRLFRMLDIRVRADCNE